MLTHSSIQLPKIDSPQHRSNDNQLRISRSKEISRSRKNVYRAPTKTRQNMRDLKTMPFILWSGKTVAACGLSTELQCSSLVSSQRVFLSSGTSLPQMTNSARASTSALPTWPSAMLWPLISIQTPSSRRLSNHLTRAILYSWTPFQVRLSLKRSSCPSSNTTRPWTS